MGLKDYSLKKQTLIYFVASFVAFVLIMMGISLLIVYTTAASIKNDSEDALENQIKRNVDKVITGSSRWYAETLTTGKQNFLNIYSYAMSDTYRPDYSMGFVESYFDYDSSSLAKPLGKDSRQIFDVSFSNSGYRYANATSDNISSTAGLLDVRDRSAHLDPYFKPLYEQNEDFVLAYVGFENGLFRSYPGSNSSKPYDPRVRDWYRSAKDLEEEEVIYTSPYQDAFGRGWMITLAKPVYSGSLVGVAGADMLISNINEAIQNIKFLETGKVTLFESNGIVVADKEWERWEERLDEDVLDPKPMKYDDLSKPSVSNSLWDKINTTEIGKTKSFDEMIDGEDYLVTVSFLEGFGDKYLLVVFIPKQEIVKPVEDIKDDMDDVTATIRNGLLIIAAISSVVIFIFSFLMTNAIIKPFNEIKKNFKKMKDNIGGEDIGEGLIPISEGFGAEQKEMATEFNTMVVNLQKSRDKTSAYVVNPYYQGNHDYIVNPYVEGNQGMFLQPGGVKGYGVP